MALNTGEIPIQSGGPSGPVGGSLPAVPSALAGGLAAIGTAGEQLAHRMQEREDRDAVANAHLQVSQAATDMLAIQQQTQAETPDDPTGYTPKVAKAMDDYSAKLIGQQQNPVARDYAMRAMAALRTAQLDSAMRWEATQKVRYRVDQTGQIADNYSAYLAKEPDDYDAVHDGVMASIDAMELPPDARARLREATSKQLTLAAARGFSMQSPLLAQKYLNNRLGLTEPTDTPAASSASAAGGDAAPPAATAGAGGFDAAYARIARIEKGRVENDAGAGLTVNGLNKQANPDLDIGNLTPDQERAAYKSRYWDAIGADKLDPKAAQFAFDTAVNQGQGFAKKMIADSGGDLDRMLALRVARYQQTATDPLKSANLPGWLARSQLLYNELRAHSPDTPVQVAMANTGTMVDVAPALPIESLPTVNVEHKANVSFLDRLDAQQLVQLKTETDTLVRKDQADAQAQVRAQYHNAAAMAERGTIPAMPDADLMTRAFGPGKAAEETAKFDTLRRYGAAAASVGTMTDAQIEATTAALAPKSIDDPEWATKAAQHDAFVKAGNAVVKARDKDPIAAARDQDIGTVQPLDFSQPAQFVAELANRQALATTMHDKYGTASLSPFTNDEAKALAENFHTLTPSDGLAMMTSLRAGLGDDRVYRAAVATFAKDDPAIQAAGAFAGMGAGFKAPDGTPASQVALTLMQGARILYPDRYAKAENKGRAYTLPPTSGAAGMDQYIAQQLGPAYMNDAETFSRAKQGVYAYYAAKSAAAGAYNEPAFDSGRLDDAINNVVGARSKWATNFFGFGGQPVLMPWGMKEEEFRGNLQRSYRLSMDAAGLGGTAVDNPRGLDLLRLDDYHYGLRAGASVVVGRNGTPVVLDVSPTSPSP